MLDVTVERSKWLRGEGSAHSKLRREKDSKMCCWGFAALACGYTRKQITGVTSPASLVRLLLDKNLFPLKVIEVGEFVTMVNSDTTSATMDINDDVITEDEFKELILTKDFSTLGINLTFVD